MNLRAPSQKLTATSSDIHLFTTGNFSHERYGDIVVDQPFYDSLIANFEPERCIVDYLHSSLSDSHENAIQAGKLTALSQQGEKLYGTPQWTPRATEYIANGEYSWISPEFTRDHIDNFGEHKGPKLLAAALCSRPWFEILEEVTLSRDRVSKEFTLQHKYPIEEISDFALTVEKNGTRYRVPYAVYGSGDTDVHIPQESLWKPKEETMPKKVIKKSPDPVSEFWALVRKNQLDNPGLSASESRKTVLKEHKKFRAMFPEPQKLKETENPYQDLFFRKSWAWREQNPTKSFFAARCEVKLAHPELFRAAFGGTEEIRFCGAAEWEMLSRNVPLDQGYKFAAQSLPSEANWMALRGIR